MIKPYYQDKWVTIFHGDCREILPQLDIKVDLVLTDPPYGIEVDVNDKWFDWLPLVMEIPLKIFTPGIANIWRYPPADWVLGWMKPGSTRRNGTGGFNHWEPILQYGRNKFDVDAIYLPDCVNHADATCGKHPNPKPIALFTWLIANTEAKTILDPFLGSGTTCYCAKKLNRYSVGIEIEEKYCEIAAKRCSQSVMELNI